VRKGSAVYQSISLSQVPAGVEEEQVAVHGDEEVHEGGLDVAGQRRRAQGVAQKDPGDVRLLGADRQ